MSRHVRVLMTHAESNAGGNPTPKRLCRVMEACGDVTVADYAPHRARSGEWDVIHLYWPEWLLDRGGGLMRLRASAARVIRTLAAARKRGTKIFWTANNIRAHEQDRGGVLAKYFDHIAALTDYIVSPSQTVLDQFQLDYPAISSKPQRVIPIGHYRGLYPDAHVTKAEARQRLGIPVDKKVVATVGLIRPYKNVPHIIRAFAEVKRGMPEAALLVAGRPQTAQLAHEIRALAAATEDVYLDLQHVADEEMQYYVRASDCYLIGTSYAVTTGTGFMSLSFDRPVMMPRRGAAYEMADNLGDEWVQLYDGGIRASVVRRALETTVPGTECDLDRHYSWDRAGEQYLQYYRDVLEFAQSSAAH